MSQSIAELNAKLVMLERLRSKGYLAHELLGYNLDVGCGLEGEKHDYNLKDAIYLNPMNDPEVSGLVYDVFCLLHSFDWVVSGDTDEDDYRKDVAAFKKRWFKKARAEQVRAIIDICTDNLKDYFYKIASCSGFSVTRILFRFLRKNDRTVFTLIPNCCDISLAEHLSAYKASIRL